MIYQNIIFDLDGTLIDSAQITGRIIDQMLAERGAGQLADRDLIKAMDAVGGEAMIAAVMGKHTVSPLADLETFRHRHRRISVASDFLFSGVAETLADLRACGVSLAICSNKPQFLCDKILQDLDLAQHFAAVIGSAPERPRKPDPACALMAMKALDADPRTTLFCGDSAIDVATARAARLDVCLVAWGYGTKDALALDPEQAVAGSMADLVDFVHGGVGLSPLPK